MFSWCIDYVILISAVFFSQKLSFSDDEDDEKSKNKGRSRKQSVFKPSDKPLEKKDTIDKEGDLRNSKVLLSI